MNLILILIIIFFANGVLTQEVLYEESASMNERLEALYNIHLRKEIEINYLKLQNNTIPTDFYKLAEDNFITIYNPIITSKINEIEQDRNFKLLNKLWSLDVNYIGNNIANTILKNIDSIYLNQTYEVN